MGRRHAVISHIKYAMAADPPMTIIVALPKTKEPL